mgnify:CR=1 FL=1|jgi:hypothetical protein
MTSSTPPVSDILRGIEGLAARSGEMLAEALNLIEQASRAEAAAMETAVAALGESHAKTVVDLARMPLAAETTRVLVAIRSAADNMLSATSGNSVEVASSLIAPSTVAQEHPHPVASSPQADASGKVIFYGIAVSSSRIAEAEEVVAAARTAVAQNRKANPYDHYRGKNSWCKSLFLAAFAQISSEIAAQRDPGGLNDQNDTPGHQDVPDVAPPHAVAVPERPSIAAAGPVRTSRLAPVHPPQIAPISRPSSGSSSRLHAQGITAQTIEDPVKFAETSPQAKKPPVRSFFNKQRVR